jgi:Spy/CpxP family protein refolding chaperone
MRGTWIKSTVLMLGMTLAGTALVAQQASPSATSEAPQATAQSAPAANGAKLNLTPDQKKQLRQLRLSARDQAAIIRNDQTLTPAQRMDKLKALRTSTHQQMKAVLTPEQQNIVAEKRAARRERIAAKLGLTADQQTKLKDLFKSTREERQSVLTSTTLSNDQKAAQLKQIRENAKTQMSTILSPEQLQKFRQMRREHRMHGGMMHKQG